MSPLRPRIQQKLDGMVARVHELLAQSSDPKLVERPDRLAAHPREVVLPGALLDATGDDRPEEIRIHLRVIGDNLGDGAGVL